MRRPAPLLPLILVVAGVCACGNEERTDPGFTVRDSAGVEIIEHGSLPERTAFRVGEPVYRVGWSLTGHQFDRLASGVLLSAGRAAVGDIGSRQVVLLDDSGHVEAALGGRGEGPAEIGLLVSVSRLPGDTLVVEDDGNARFTLFHGRELVGSHPNEGVSPYALRVIGVEGSTLIMTTSSYTTYFEQPWLQFHVVRHTPGAEQWDTVHAYDSAPRIVEGKPLNPFLPGGSAAVTEGAVVTTRSDRPQMELVGLQGGITRIVRWTEDPVQPTEAHWAEFLEFWRTFSGNLHEEESARQLAETRAAIEGPVPYIGKLFGDVQGRVWISTYAGDYRHPTRYRLFDTSGDWLGWVDLPKRTEILDIGEDVILAIQRNESDVEAVALLPLLPSLQDR